jgi:hypothetical protein
VLVSGPFVAISGKGGADTSGLGQTFVGVALLGVANVRGLNARVEGPAESGSSASRVEAVPVRI